MSLCAFCGCHVDSRKFFGDRDELGAAQMVQSSWRQEKEGSDMKDAKELLEEFTAESFRDPKKAAEMFAEDGAFEMPYLESLGVPGRYEGREAIEGFFRFVRDVYPDMDLENIKLMIDTPEQVFAENGRIKLLRESVNLVEVALGVFPNGLADYKAPAEHKA